MMGCERADDTLRHGVGRDGMATDGMGWDAMGWDGCDGM
jgi:hypothetical protein